MPWASVCVGEGALGGIAVVGAGGDLGFQGGEGGVELVEERLLRGGAGAGAGVRVPGVEVEVGLDPGAGEGKPAEDRDVTGDAEGETDGGAGDVGLRVGGEGA